MSKPKSEPVTKWCVLNPNFSFTAEENAIINRHDAVWREHCQGGKATDPLSLELEYRSFENGAGDGDLEALKMLRDFGTLESFTRYRRSEQAGRRVRFDRENAALFTEVHPIAKRLREIFEKLLTQYREGCEDERRLLGLSPVLNDDATSLMERQISSLFAVESHQPSVFEVLANHVNLIEIEEDAE